MQKLIEIAHTWLEKEAVPLWFGIGFDRKNNGFVEEISFTGEAKIESPRRIIVQARQIYCLRTLANMGILEKNFAKSTVRIGIDKIISSYSLPNGSFVFSATAAGKPVDERYHLYSNSFALFALANAYDVEKDSKYKSCALALLEYLNKEKKAEGGGYKEQYENQAAYEANPHMHLFEALLYWMMQDTDPIWRKHADEILALCFESFIDPALGVLGEHYEPGWKRKRTMGNFLFEPGHHYEWAWLIWLYDSLTNTNHSKKIELLYSVAEKHGICPKRGVVFDSVWSDFNVHRKTSRYWPQCERIKAALRLADTTLPEAKHSADAALETLLLYLKTPVKGHCYDLMLEDGSFSSEPPKAGCFYHIVNALAEYSSVRPSLR